MTIVVYRSNEIHYVKQCMLKWIVIYILRSMFQFFILLLLVRLHDQSSSSDEVGGLLQVLQTPISEEHARSSGPPHHRDTLGKERFLVTCACVRWPCCGRSAVVPKPHGRACQEGGMHPSLFWVSALFWWWWSFPGYGCWLMVALLVLHILLNTRNLIPLG